jgi:DNA repair protein RadA/Sms
MGRCGECQAWGTIAEPGARTPPVRLSAGPVTAPATPIAAVGAEVASVQPTGVAELDRVLGGGLVPGAVVLLAGEPGVGKSTLLLTVADRVAATTGQPTLIVTGEESTAQVRLRAHRVGALRPRLFLAAENDLSAIVSHVDAVQPTLLVVDSVQTISTDAVDAPAGSVSQVRAVAAALIALAKERGIATVLVGHVTKDGGIAGPRVLEHLVDVVLHFEGDRHGALRIIRAAKNRFGATDEVGCFEMREDGIVGLPDPSGLFLSERPTAVPGTCVTVTLEGRRPLVTEVQALVTAGPGGSPRRAVSNLDAARVSMLVAIITRHGGIPLADREVYAATVGGLAATEPAADLAILLALASAARNAPLPPTVCAIGEVSLSGDVRRVSGLSRRLAEAARLGFTTALVPAGYDADGGGLAIRTVPVPSLLAAMDVAANLAQHAGERRRPVLRAVPDSENRGKSGGPGGISA